LAAKRLATAMMDLSDGLSTDVSRLCAASQVGARIAIDKVPKAQAILRKGRTSISLTEMALHGGDDYELLFTARPNLAARVPTSFRGLPLSCIGEITRERKLLLVGPEGLEEKLVAGGWDPF
jgi:thiamine-monophosphate kinase